MFNFARDFEVCFYKGISCFLLIVFGSLSSI